MKYYIFLINNSKLLVHKRLEGFSFSCSDCIQNKYLYDVSVKFHLNQNISWAAAKPVQKISKKQILVFS